MQFINFIHKKLNVKISKRRGKVFFIAESQNMIQILYHIENLDQLNIFIITPNLHNFRKCNYSFTQQIPLLNLNQS